MYIITGTNKIGGYAKMYRTTYREAVKAAREIRETLGYRLVEIRRTPK